MSDSQARRSAVAPSAAPHGARLALRAAFTAPVLSLFVIVVVALLAAAGTAAPALLATARTDTVRTAVDELAPTQRDLVGTIRGIPVGRAADGPAADRIVAAAGSDGAMWGGTLATLAKERDDFAPTLRTATGQPEAFIRMDASSTARDDETPVPKNLVGVVFDPTVHAAVEMVQGSFPEIDRSRPLSTESPEADPATTSAMPIALAEDVAAALDWSIGEERWTSFWVGNHRLELVGIFAPRDRSDPVWSYLPTAIRPASVMDPAGDLIQTANAIGAAGGAFALGEFAAVATTSVRYPLEIGGVDGATATDLAAHIRGTMATPLRLPIANSFGGSAGIAMRSSAPGAIDEGVERAEAMTAVVVTVAVGPVAVAVVALALTGRMLAVRRAGSARLARARGASLPRLTALLAGEGAVLGLLGAIIGVLVALALGAWGGPVSLLVPLLAALTPAAVLPASTLTRASRTARADLDQGSGASGRRRLLVEAVVVAVAVALVALVVSRGVRSGGDLLRPLVPLAVGAVAAIIALRLVPLVLGVIEARASASRSVVALVGPARARRDPAVRAAPVLAVVIGISTALFSVAFTATVHGGIDRTAQVQIGADLRIFGLHLNAEQVAAIAEPAGVAAVAPVTASDRVDAETDSGDVPLIVYAVDGAQLRSVQQGRDTALPVPPEAVDGQRVPVVASERLAERVGDGSLQIGDAELEIVATAPDRSALGGAASWVLVDRALADRLGNVAPGAQVVLVRLADDADIAHARDAVTAAAGTAAAVRAPADVVDQLREDPALRAVQSALLAAVTVVALLLGFAVGMTLLLGSVARGRLLALLAALGYPRRREVPLVVWEVAPALLVALPLGVAAGLALPPLLLPTLDLVAFVGGTTAPPILFGGSAPVVVVAGFLLVGAVAIVIAALAASRVTAAATLRASDEEG